MKRCKKGSLDAELDTVLDEYQRYFGQNYPLSISGYNGTAEDIIKRARECIESNVPLPEPEYDPDCIY